MVVDDAVARLRPLVSTIHHPAEPILQRYATVQHLGTPISGRTNGPLLELVAVLHPTAAVGGAPRSDALAFIEKQEGIDRGWYSGGIGWVDPSGDGELAIVSWGSTASVVREALRRLPDDLAAKMKLISMRLLLPVRQDEMAVALDGVKRLIVIEQNHTGQLYRFLRGWYDLPADVDTWHRPGPDVFRPGEIATKLTQWSER